MIDILKIVGYVLVIFLAAWLGQVFHDYAKKNRFR